MKIKLSKTICKFPSEWVRDDVQARWSWFKEPGNPYKLHPMNEESYQRLVAFAGKLCFWEDLPKQDQERLGKKHWHFHPREFIKHFRKCGWLSKEEIRQLVPRAAIRTHQGKVLWESVTSNDNNSIFQNHLLPLNLMMRKYGIVGAMRQASFFGNAIQETRWLDSLVESGGSERWYGPWHGRGFLQLTNPDNYCSYWAWRGRRIDPALRKALVDAYHQAAKKKRNEALQDKSFPALTQVIKRWRTEVQAGAIPTTDENVIAPSDSAGFYWLKSGMAHYADQPHVLEAHAVQTNDGQKTYYRSPAFWKASAAVNLPSAVKHKNYSGLNGFDSRCCAYGIALAVLSEVLLPDDKGNPTLMFPNDFLPRR